MPNASAFRVIASSLVAAVPIFVAGVAYADLPAGYAGRPFDPAIAGGKGICPPTVKAGPYAIPGRLDFVNYDMGGDGIAFHAGDKDLMKAGYGYRTDHPAATISKTSMAEMDVWYMSGNATLDGTQYPSPTTTDFYLGAIQVDDWFNFTVSVQTAGTYSLSSTWSSGNGPPGGEGGDGSMGLEVFVNGTKVATWSATFPNYMTEANFHHWQPYPNFATITLQPGMQLIKLQSTSKHLNLDYVDFELMGADGGTTASPEGGTTAEAGTSGSTGSSGASASGASSGTASSGTVVATSGSATSGASTSGVSTATSGTIASTSGTGGSSGTATAQSGTTASGAEAIPTSTTSTSSGKGCAIAGLSPSRPSGIALLFGLCSAFLARRANRRRS